MRVHGDYSAAGYALVERLLCAEMAKALLDRIWSDVRDEKLQLRHAPANPLLTKPAMELHGARHPPLTSFQWGLTPLLSQLTGKALLPTYCFFRLYQRGDRLRVHADRQACEHSLSLTLGYSDGRVWPFEVGEQPARPGSAEDFADEPFSSLDMGPGDAVIYRGIDRRHGRISPNPNQWSAHLFCHWVTADGPHRHLAFEDVAADDA
jgi:alkylated DNA repair dioxygenase AlkB